MENQKKILLKGPFRSLQVGFGSGGLQAARGSPEGNSMASVLASSRQRLQRRHKKLNLIFNFLLSKRKQIYSSEN